MVVAAVRWLRQNFYRTFRRIQVPQQAMVEVWSVLYPKPSGSIGSQGPAEEHW